MTRVKTIKKSSEKKETPSLVSESVFKSLAENASSAIFVFQGAKLIYVNPASEILTGYSREELLQVNIFNLVDHDFRKTIIDRAARRMRGDSEPSRYEVKIITKTGEERWVDFSGGMMLLDKKLVSTGTAIDITERKRVELIQEAVFKIVQAADRAETLDELLPVLHAIIGEVMNAENFYIALYDAEQGLLSFPYFVDEVDSPSPPSKPGKGLTEYVLRTGQSLLLDPEKDAELQKNGEIEMVGVPCPIWLGVPLKVLDKTIGVMVVQHYSDPKAYGELEKRILEFVSSQVAVVINRKRAEEALRNSEERYRRQANELAVLYETTRDLALQRDLSVLLNIIADRVIELIHSSGCTIYLHDPEKNHLEAFVARGWDGIVGTILEMGEGLAGKVAQTLKASTIKDHSTWKGRSTKFNGMPVTAVLGVPMLYSGELVGVLTVFEIETDGKIPVREFSEADKNLLTVFAGTAASAVNNARLFEETRQRLLELEVLYRASLASAQIHSLTAVAERVIETLDQLMNWQRVSIWVIDGEKGKPVLLARNSTGLRGDALKAELERLNTLIADMDHGIVGWVCTHGKSVRTGNVRTNPHFLENAPGIHSELCVPLRIGGRTIGCINVNSREVDAFSEHDERLLSTLAGQTAVAIENARLYQEALTSAEQRSVLYQASQEIARSSQDPEQVYIAVHRAASQLMPCDAFVITLAHEEKQEIHGVYLFDHGIRHPGNILRYGEGISWRVITTGKALSIQDFNQSDDGIVRHVFGTGGGARSLLAVPMRSGQEIIGMISAQSYEPGKYTEEDAVLLETLGANAGVAIENARLFDQTRQRVLMQAALNSIITAAARGTIDLDALLNIALDQALATLRLEVGAVWLLWQYHGLPRYTARGFIANSEEIIQLFNEISTDLTHSNMIKDWEMDDHPTAPAIMNHGIRSSVIVPLLSGGRHIGGIVIGSAVIHEWPDEEIAFVEGVGREVGSAAEMVRLFNETQARMVELESVYRVSIALRQAQSMDEMLPMLLDEALNALDASIGSIWLVEPKGNGLKQAIGRGWFREFREVELEQGEGIPGRVFSTGDIYFSNDLATDPITGRKIQGYIPSGWRGVCVPILAEREIIGTIFVAASIPREFSSDNANLLVTIAEIAGNAIHRMRLHEKTEQHAAELETRVVERTAELQSALRKAQEADNLKSEFIANVNHELRTPLTNLVLYYQMLRSQPSVRTEERMDVIGREIQRLRVLIEDLLNLSRMDLGQISFHMLPDDINKIVQTMANDRHSLAEERRLTLVTDLAPDLPPVMMDENLISQAISNLMTNALHYTPADRKVCIRTFTKQMDGMQWVGMSVQDDGPGIDAEDLPHLFDRFFRGKVGQQSGSPGTGLGLAIVKQVVTRHRGKLEVDPGKYGQRGATFTIWLPVNQKQETE